MRNLGCLTLMIVLMPLAANAQNLYAKKDLAFAQVAAGGAYETVINVTNRGSSAYNGSLVFYHLVGAAWNPFVNGVQATNGQMNVSIAKGATQTFRVTQTGGTEAGFAFFVASDLAQTSFLEGTLTYYVRNSGILADSVGVQPSSEFYLTAVPFDDFSKLAVALANLNTAAVTVRLSVFSDTNVLLAPPLERQFASGEHLPKYLRELFPNVQAVKGRLEILSSSSPIIGTMLTDVDNQFSSLPMQPAVKAYTFTGSLAGISFTGEISLWLDGLFVQGFLRVLTTGGIPEQNPETLPLSGSLLNGVLVMITSGNPGADDPLLVHSTIASFSLARATMQASSVGWWLDSHELLGAGTMTLTAVN